MGGGRTTPPNILEEFPKGGFLPKLFLDPSEVRERTKAVFGDLEYTVVPDLEMMTGADMMVSVYNAPATTRKLIQMHLKNKALLVQRKHRMDLVHSLNSRLKSSLIRMRSLGARPGQCLLLFIGNLSCGKDGNALIDGVRTGRNFWSVYAGLSVWIKYGGAVEPSLPKAHMLPDWVKMKWRHIQESVDVPVKEFIVEVDPLYQVDSNDPIQELVMVRDWRRAAMCIPGWGAKRVTTLSDVMKQDGCQLTLLNALDYMTTMDKAIRIPGVGKSLVDATRRWIGNDQPSGVVAPPRRTGRGKGRAK